MPDALPAPCCEVVEFDCTVPLPETLTEPDTSSMRSAAADTSAAASATPFTVFTPPEPVPCGTGVYVNMITGGTVCVLVDEPV